MEPLKIGFPMMSVKHHGGVRVLLHLASYLAERGHRVHLLVPKNQFAPLYPVSPKVRVELLRASGGPGVLGKAKSLWDLWRGLLDLSPDVVVANFFPTAYISWPMRKKSLVVHLVQDSPKMFSGPITSRAVRVSLGFSYKKIAITKFIAEDCQADAVVPPGVTESFWPDPDPELVATKYAPAVLHMPRRQLYKGLETFLGAVLRLRDMGVIPELWLVTKEPEVLSAFDQHQLHYKVLTAPDDDALRKIYSSADLFVLSSGAEGFALPPLEAMASGVPVVATDAGGIREYARPGENCLLVPPGDPDALARAMMRVLGDRSLAGRLVAGGLATAKHFTMERFSREVAERIEEWALS